MANDDGYKQALRDALREYAELSRKREEMDHRLAQLAQTIGGLARLCGLQPEVPWGITDACRMILRTAGRPLSPTEIRDQLTAMGFDLSRYSNQLASIHTVLKRLHGSGEAHVETGEKSASVYSWKGLGYVPFDIAALMGLDAPAKPERPEPRKRKSKKDDEGGD